MKKVLLMIICFVLLLGLVGCNNYETVQVQIFSSRDSSTEVQNRANIWLITKGNTIKVISTEYKIKIIDSYSVTYYIMITYQEKIK